MSTHLHDQAHVLAVGGAGAVHLDQPAGMGGRVFQAGQVRFPRRIPVAVTSAAGQLIALPPNFTAMLALLSPLWRTSRTRTWRPARSLAVARHTCPRCTAGQGQTAAKGRQEAGLRVRDWKAGGSSGQQACKGSLPLHASSTSAHTPVTPSLTCGSFFTATRLPRHTASYTVPKPPWPCRGWVRAGARQSR